MAGIASYFLKISPQLSQNDAAKTEQQLNGRYKKVAKKYGQEMDRQHAKTADTFVVEMKKGFGKVKTAWVAVAAAAAAAAGAIMSNPFNEADQKLNEILNKFDNISTRAKQWGVDSGRYWLLNQVGQATDVPEGGIDQMLLRIADKLDAARSGEDQTLENYLDQGDIIDVAYKLFNTWRQMQPVERAASMADVLGLRAANNYAELVDADWNAIADSLRAGRSTQQFGGRIDYLADLQGQQALNRARLANVELFRAGDEINRDTLGWQTKVESVKQRELLDDVRDFERVALSEISRINTLANTVDEISDSINKIWGMMADRWGFNGAEGEERARQRQEELFRQVRNGVNNAADDVGVSRNLFRYGIGGL